LNGTQLNLGAQVSLKEATDRADLLLIQSSTSSWGGIQIGNSSGETLTSFMGDGANFGIYDDQNNEWVLYATENAGVALYHNGSSKISTTSTGTTTTGTAVATKFQTDSTKIETAIFRINDQTLTTNTTIATDENASCAGPLTINTGVTLTVSGNLTVV